MTNFKELFSGLLGLFFPENCASCAGNLLRGEETICTVCRSRLIFFEDDLPDNLAARFAAHPQIRFAGAGLNFARETVVQQLVHALKYENRPEIGVLLGRMAGRALQEKQLCSEAEMLVPVPLHERKLRSRGYNQAERIAAGLSEVLNIPVEKNALFRTKFTETQTLKNRQERQENVSGVFRSETIIVSGCRLLLVDDVITTGATTESCIESLIAGGCSSVSLFGLARTGS